MTWTGLVILASLGLGASPGLGVEPGRVELRGPDRPAQVVVTGPSGDLTDSARYVSGDPGVVLVESDGLVRPVGDGATTIEISAGGATALLPVTVAGFAADRAVDFAGEVLPILTRAGCNAGGCHGKASGQNGFRLSLLGFDPRADFEAIVREGRGRRVFPADPGASLFLQKPTAQVPHGGGRRFAVGSPEYRTLARWVGQGMPIGRGDGPKLAGLEVTPGRRVVARGGRQQLRVVARSSDGSTADVTRLAQFQSNAADLAEVDDRGVVRALGGVGEAAIMARFGGLVAVARVAIPTGAGGDWSEPDSDNFLDPLAARKLRELGLRPAGPCTDAEFARRSALDVCGILPEPGEVAAFEADGGLDKRARWVDRLLDRPEHADLFAMKWSAILRNRRDLGEIARPGSYAFHGWIRQAIAENRPYDRFVAEIVGARGDPASHPPAVWYRQVRTLEERVDDTAQLFLGVRLGCARCHHHPTERWGQDDYYGFASLFARVGTKPGADPTAPRVYNLPSGLAANPRTGAPERPRPLGADALGDLGPRDDPRDGLVAWLRRPDNPYFARAVVNRYWKHFLGRGLVEPEDDLRASNPPSDPDLLDALADDFVRNGYDLKRLARTIATSRAYGRSSRPVEGNRDDRRNFARFTPRRLPAEVLLDAVGVVAGSREAFPGVPPGTRAVELPDDGFASEFLDVFGRPRRETACECERSAEANLAQTLHLVSADALQARLAADTGRPARLARDPRPDGAKVEELYRVALARRPTGPELADCLAFLEPRRAAGKIREGFEDLAWTLINTKEFLFNH